ncbi:unnamed protein product, partial [Laminaria digitata]
LLLSISSIHAFLLFKDRNPGIFVNRSSCSQSRQFLHSCSSTIETPTGIFVNRSTLLLSITSVLAFLLLKKKINNNNNNNHNTGSVNRSSCSSIVSIVAFLLFKNK